VKGCDMVEVVRSFVRVNWYQLTTLIIICLGWVFSYATINAQVNQNTLDIMPRKEIEIQLSNQKENISEIKEDIKEIKTLLIKLATENK
jgi:hypothetical protein